jgi:hypothetical protein
VSTDTIWVADAPVKYEIRKAEASDMRGPAVRIARYEDNNANCQQALLEVQYDGDALRLVQIDGDLNAKKMIAEDQKYLDTYGERRLDIWRRIWAVATGDAK